jgi:hypothetical protein
MKVGIICPGLWIHQLIIIDMGIMMVLRKISLLPLLLNLHHPQRQLGLLARRVNRTRVPRCQLLQYLQAVDGDWGLGIVYPVRFSLLNRSSLISSSFCHGGCSLRLPAVMIYLGDLRMLGFDNDRNEGQCSDVV